MCACMHATPKNTNTIFVQFQESRAAEEEKQQRMKEERNDKARRRAAMCENLGRGC